MKTIPFGNAEFFSKRGYLGIKPSDSDIETVSDKKSYNLDLNLDGKNAIIKNSNIRGQIDGYQADLKISEGSEVGGLKIQSGNLSANASKFKFSKMDLFETNSDFKNVEIQDSIMEIEGGSAKISSNSVIDNTKINAKKTDLEMNKSKLFGSIEANNSNIEIANSFVSATNKNNISPYIDTDGKIKILNSKLDCKVEVLPENLEVENSSIKKIVFKRKLRNAHYLSNNLPQLKEQANRPIIKLYSNDSREYKGYELYSSRESKTTTIIAPPLKDNQGKPFTDGFTFVNGKNILEDSPVKSYLEYQKKVPDAPNIDSNYYNSIDRLNKKYKEQSNPTSAYILPKQVSVEEIVCKEPIELYLPEALESNVSIEGAKEIIYY